VEAIPSSQLAAINLFSKRAAQKVKSLRRGVNSTDLMEPISLCEFTKSQ
jgi:hypothetical protein